jgi:hypothetical protein
MVPSTTRFVLPCASLLALLAPPLPAADPPPDTEVRRALLAGWQQYDPSIREAHLAARAATPPADPIPAPAAGPATASPAPAAPVASNDIVVLPKMMVEGVREKPRPRLPRLQPPAPVKVLPAEPFESPEGRRARLVQKHFTRLEQALGRLQIPLIGQSLTGRAAQREAAESAALQLNEIADVLEIFALLGLDSPEEQRALRAEFLKVYHARPR